MIAYIHYQCARLEVHKLNSPIEQGLVRLAHVYFAHKLSVHTILHSTHIQRTLTLSGFGADTDMVNERTHKMRLFAAYLQGSRSPAFAMYDLA